MTPVAPTGAGAAARVSAPLAPAALALQAALTERHDRAGYPWVPGAVPPRVVALGDADVLGAADPRRAAANVTLTSGAVLVGPWSAPGAAPAVPACGHCLGVRWQRLRFRTERDALEIGTEMTPAGSWPLLSAYVVDATWSLYEATVLGRAETPLTLAHTTGDGDADAALPRVCALDLRTLQVRTVPILADPLCPGCAVSGTDSPVAGPLTLTPHGKRTPDSYRLRSADSYPLPVQALANPVCGALGAGTFINVTSPTTAPVTGSVFIRGYAGLLDVSWSGQANSFATSRSLAFLEGLERYAGSHRRRAERLVVDSYANVADHALNPEDCGLYDPDVYRTDPLAAPYSPDAAIPWIWGYSLRDERPILVPRRFCHFSSGAPGDNFVFSSSNGSATGSCLEEAVLFGLLELIERDSFLLGWYGNADLPRIDLDSCDNDVVRAMVDRAALQGYDILAFDNRIDLAVPVVTSLAVRRDGGPGTLSFAAAAGFDPQAALEGALSEALTYIPQQPRSVRRREPELRAMMHDYRLVRQLTDHAGLFGLPEMRHHADSYLRVTEQRPMSDLYATWNARRGASRHLLDDLRLCQQELVDAGSDVIVVDQTTPEQSRMGLRSVCTIVPGLLPIDFGWARQRALRMPRLRTAFRRAGLRDTDLADGELRVVPHPFP
ncbi:TOMM precursor leader peptide-binding protein [Catellatospora chokoriensis]|uniref:YcaO domain-containing protein n=1 Tax=Catellatospora chokoriensis TaxID=310353 RepID=A0A8J3NQ28_9ACTN|nr:TOMM precursor leader peptide-binding protein [Catellatospora chokoriensis]GIF86585.1 hypothetical protein Cch02nite_00290 [Catellatospora chokoriensis]